MADEHRRHPLASPDVARGPRFTMTVNGQPVSAHEGESVLGVLWGAGYSTLRITPRRREPRGFYCGMGVCFDCLVEVDGQVNVRACLEPARPDMSIRVPQDMAPREPAGGNGNDS